MTSQAAVLGVRRERRLYLGVAVVASLLVFTGFARTYFLKSYFGAPVLSPLVHLHGAIFTSWFALFIAQATLVAARRTDIHRRLGVVGGALAAVMLVVGYLTAIGAARRGITPPGGPPPMVFLAIPLGDLVVFGGFVAAALYFRRHVHSHKRLMTLATIGVLAPAIARLPFDFVLATGPLAFFGLTDLLLVGCVAFDAIKNGRLHPVFLWGGLLLVLSQPLRLLLAGTSSWLAFAEWLTR